MDHLKSLKIANFVIGAFTFVLGLLFIAMFVIPGLIVWWHEDESMGIVFVLAGILAFLLVGGLGVAHVIVGYLVGSGRGRLAQTWLATLQIGAFPVGTVYALYALYVCWIDEDSKKRFDKAVKPLIT